MKNSTKDGRRSTLNVTKIIMKRSSTKVIPLIETIMTFVEHKGHIHAVLHVNCSIDERNTEYIKEN